MSRIRPPLAAAAVALAASAGCSDGVSPPRGPQPLVVTLSASVIRSVSDSSVIQATVRGEPATDVRIEIASETRGLTGISVADPAALQRQVVRPTGPGTLTLTVHAAGAVSTSVTVAVVPDRPTIFAAATTGHGVGADTTILRGTGLDRLAADALRIGGEVMTMISRNPSEIRFIAPPATGAACGGREPSTAIATAGGDVIAGLTVRQSRPGDMRMAVGAWRTLTPEEAACIMLPAAHGAYVLAFGDMRQIEQARTQPAGAFPPDAHSLLIEEVSAASGSGAVRMRLPEPGSPRHAVAAAEGSSGSGSAAGAMAPLECSDTDFTSPFFSFWCRSVPWQLGDRMQIRRPGNQGETATATVYRIDDGTFVFAAIDGDTSARLRHFKAMIDEAMPIVRQHAVPLLKSSFQEAVPTTSIGSGQLLTIIGDFVHGSVAGGCCAGGGPTSTVVLGSTLDGPLPAIVYLLSHEFTHTWQRAWYHSSRPAGADPVHYSGSYWGNEGGADLIALEVVRRVAGDGWRSNMPVPVPPDPWNNPRLMEAPARGLIASGYVNASSFMRDVVARVVASGTPIDIAFREVARGSFEDWYGYGTDGVKRPGLTDRMRTLLGPAWDPSRALLLYTLSQGADELTSNPELQNPFFAGMSGDPTGTGFGHTTLVAGRAPRSVSIPREGSSVGYVRLEDAGEGATYRGTADRPGTAWAIARVR